MSKPKRRTNHFDIKMINIQELGTDEGKKLKIFKENTDSIVKIADEIENEIKKENIITRLTNPESGNTIKRLQGYIKKIQIQYDELYNNLIKEKKFNPDEYPAIVIMYENLKKEINSIKSWRDIEEKIIPKLENGNKYIMNLPSEKDGQSLHRLFLLFSGDTMSGLKPWGKDANPQIKFGPALSQIITKIKPTNLEQAYNTVYDIIKSNNIRNYTDKAIRSDLVEAIELKRFNKYEGVKSIRTFANVVKSNVKKTPIETPVDLQNFISEKYLPNTPIVVGELTTARIVTRVDTCLKRINSTNSFLSDFLKYFIKKNDKCIDLQRVYNFIQTHNNTKTFERLIKEALWKIDENGNYVYFVGRPRGQQTNGNIRPLSIPKSQPGGSNKQPPYYPLANPLKKT